MNEALVDVFKFLPHKDLDRFTLVSGPWHSLIDTHGKQFPIREINIHFNRDVRDSIVLKSGGKEVSFRYASILKSPEILKKAVENSKIVNIRANIYPRYWESRLKQMCNVFEEPVQSENSSSIYHFFQIFFFTFTRFIFFNLFHKYK